MPRRRPKAKDESLAEYRRRLIHETELALHVGLRFPERVPRIPTVEVGKGKFDAEMSKSFWEDALAVDIAKPLRRGRKWKLRIPHITVFTTR